MTAPELVHPIPGEEIAGWARAMTATFLGDPAGAEVAAMVERLSRGWDPERAWGVRDHGRWVGTLRTEARRLTVPGLHGPGRDLTVDALTNVTVAATHRRGGHMRRMLEGSLRAARERGDALSVLIAAEWPIYGRFGYAPAVWGSNYTLRRARPGSAVNGDVSRVRHVERDRFGDLAASVHEATRHWRWAGQLDRGESWWSAVLGRDGLATRRSLPHHWLLHEGDDGPDGLLAWSADGFDRLIPPFGTAQVWVLAAAGPEAYRDLWAYLSGIDGVEEIRLASRPVDEPARWLLADGRTLVMTETVDFVWARILDVPKALAARAYAVAGELVLEVRDESLGGLAAGRFCLRADGHSVACEATDAAPDLELDQRALAGAYLGAGRLTDRALAGEVVERVPGALARAELMFATPIPPWNATWF